MKRHEWTEKEEQFLKENVKGISLKELTQRYNKKFGMNLSENSIACRKNKLGLHSGITGGQFIKGRVPYNKGKKWSEYMSEEGQKNARKTIFKKGNIPPNRRSIESERIDKNGYIEIKVQDGQLNRNWVGKHRYIYEQVYGEIPKGHKVIFADGDNRNFEPDNLILVSAAEELIINQRGLYKRNKELTKTGSLIAKVIDRTNKLKR